MNHEDYPDMLILCHSIRFNPSQMNAIRDSLKVGVVVKKGSGVFSFRYPLVTVCY